MDVANSKHSKGRSPSSAARHRDNSYLHLYRCLERIRRRLHPRKPASETALLSWPLAPYGLLRSEVELPLRRFSDCHHSRGAPLHLHREISRQRTYCR